MILQNYNCVGANLERQIKIHQKEQMTWTEEGDW